MPDLMIELIDDAPGTNELIAAVYLVIGSALIDCYEHLVRDCDPLADELTIRFIERTIVPDHRERTAWAEAFLSGRDLDSTYVATVQAMLEDAGGLVVRSDDVPCDRTDEEASNGTGFWPLLRPSVDRISLGSEYRIAGRSTPSWRDRNRASRGCDSGSTHGPLRARSVRSTRRCRTIPTRR